ncbi:hypothetical protein AKO1_014219, partial [Acrasis kona]
MQNKTLFISMYGEESATATIVSCVNGIQTDKNSKTSKDCLKTFQQAYDYFFHILNNDPSFPVNITAFIIPLLNAINKYDQLKELLRKYELSSDNCVILSNLFLKYHEDTDFSTELSIRSLDSSKPLDHVQCKSMLVDAIVKNNLTVISTLAGVVCKRAGYQDVNFLLEFCELLFKSKCKEAKDVNLVLFKNSLLRSIEITEPIEIKTFEGCFMNVYENDRDFVSFLNVLFETMPI